MLTTISSNNLSGGDVRLLFVAAFVTNALNAFGPIGSAAGAGIFGTTQELIIDGEISLEDAGNILVKFAIGLAAGKVAASRFTEGEAELVKKIAAAEISSIGTSVWGWFLFLSE